MKNPTEKREREKNHDHLILPTLRLRYAQSKVNMGLFLKEGQGRQLVFKESLPMEAQQWMTDHHPHLESLCISLWTANSEYSMEVDLWEHPYLACYYYMELIFQELKGSFAIYKRIGPSTCCLWEEEVQREGRKLRIYQKYAMQIIQQDEKGEALLRISYLGTAAVFKKSVETCIEQYHVESQLLNELVYEHQLYHYHNLPEALRYESAYLFPVLHNELANALGLPYRQAHYKYDYPEVFRKIQTFYLQYIKRPQFLKQIPLSEQWEEVPKTYIHQIAQLERDLVFGKNRISHDRVQGLLQYGPYRLPQARHYKLFFIYPRHSHKKKKILEGHLSGKEGYCSLIACTRIPLVYEESLDMVLEEGETAIQQRIKKLDLDNDSQYFAIYISPYGPFEKDKERRQLYYTVKERLLKKSIASQCIMASKIKGSNLNAIIPNLALSMILKMGGMPWRLAEINMTPSIYQEDLVIGYGLFTTEIIGKDRMISVFCLQGEIWYYDCFPEEEEWAIYAFILEAIDAHEKRKGPLKLLVIHYTNESGLLWEAKNIAKELELEIPVIQIEFHLQTNTEQWVFSLSDPYHLPKRGQYIRISEEEYLLYLHSDEEGWNRMAAPLALSISCNEESLLEDPQLLANLMQKIYDLSLLNWQSSSPGLLPISISYLQMLAAVFPHFQTRMMPELWKEGLWFV